jgi:hypothetical protein
MPQSPSIIATRSPSNDVILYNYESRATIKHPIMGDFPWSSILIFRGGQRQVWANRIP